MSFGRWCVVLSCLISPGFAVAQGETPKASTEAGGAEVVVQGVRDRKPGNWKRSESDHVVVIGQDGAGELTRITRNLETLYQLMSRLYRRGDTADDTVKPRVVLFGSPSDFRALGLKSSRSQQGPYPPAFDDQAYYDPREDGEVIAMARGEQIIDLNTSRSYNMDCDDILGEGGMEGCSNKVPHHSPAVRTWEQALYARFAQHFLMTYHPQAYPRWYVDAVGALFSTVNIRGDGGIDYAGIPSPYKQVFRSYGDLDVAGILTGRYLDAANKPGKAVWTPYHAWLIAHYFLFSKLKPERSRQFQTYMADIARGVSMAEAAKAFGDLGALQRDIMHYGNIDIVYARAEPPRTPAGEPLITTLSPGSAALVEARLQLDTRLADADSAGSVDSGLLAKARAEAALPYDANSILFAAEAECQSGHHDACLADAERVLARTPDDVRALSWKGVALTDQAIAGPASGRAATLASARATIERAMALDEQAPLPSIAYFQSFTKPGETVPERAMRAMANVVRMVPAAPAPRLYLGEELMRQGQPDLARRLLQTVLYGPYESPEKRVAEALFASAVARP